MPAKVAELAYAFTLADAGTDEYGIAKGTEQVVRDSAGQRVPIDEATTARIKESTGRIREAGDAGVCTTYETEALLVCGVQAGARTAGVMLRIESVQFASPVPWLLLVIALAGVAQFLAARRWSGRAGWLATAAIATVAGAAGALILTHAASGMIALGAGFTVFVALAAAAIGTGLASPASRLFYGLRDKPFLYAAIAPAMVGMVLLIFVPFFMGVYLAFLDNSGSFVGLANFADILFPDETSDTNFYFTLGVTVAWTVLNVFLHVAIGLVLAIVLSDAKMKGRAVYRVLLIIPWAVPNYITALIWKWIFNTELGPANAFLALLGVAPIDWLGRSFLTNFTANLVTNTWLGFPFMMIVSLGALQSIPADLYEAAEMDGAGRWKRFWHVTLPLLKPALFPAIILGTIWTFNMFNVVYLVSGGAPDNQTNILITEAYRAFRVLKNYGIAAAYSLIIFVILAAYTALTNRMTRAAESVYE